jgi:hypothetical protein
MLDDGMGQDRDTETVLTRLRQCSALAWDFDMTLVGHLAAHAMHRFIADTPHIEHMIVTFRSHGIQHRIWGDLASQGGVLGQKHFSRAINIDDHLADTVQRLRRQRAQRLYAGPDSPAERAYRHWKGMVCAQLGAAVLIDDRTEDVKPGCDAFGIALLHPDIFL